MKRTKLFVCSIILILIVSLILPMYGFAESAETAITTISKKISAELIDEFSIIDDNTKIPVNVTLMDIPEEMVMELFAKRYPYEYEVYMEAKYGSETDIESLVIGDTMPKVDAIPTINIDAEGLQRAIELKRALYRELYAKSNAAFLKDYTNEEDRIFVSSYAPFAIVEATQGTIETMAAKGTVYSISKFINAKGQDEDLNQANQITGANYVRDTYGAKGAGIKIGQIEPGVPYKYDSYLNQASITIHSKAGSTTDHATMVARILVGTDPTGANDGLAPNAMLYSTTFDENDAVTTFYSNVEWILNKGVNVINMSAGINSSGTYSALDKWVDHIAMSHDVHFVKSAGNDAGYITSPGMAYNAITVGGLDNNGSTSVSNFSLY